MIGRMSIVTENIGPLALKRLLHARDQREVGRFSKYAPADDAISFAFNAEEDLAVDTKRMMVGPTIISTPVVDRVGDVVVPMGIRLDKYKANPVVLWEHGYSAEDEGSLPIASSEDPETGELRIEADARGVKSWDFFHGKTRLSNQVFRLIDLKAIRAKSIRPSGIVTAFVQDMETGDVGLHFVEWDLIEHSWVGIGCNPECVMKTVRDKMLDGERLAVPLLKSLAPLVPGKQAIGVGLPDALRGKAAPPPPKAKDDKENTDAQDEPKPGEGKETTDSAATDDAPPPAATKTDDAPPADDVPADSGTDEQTAEDAEPAAEGADDSTAKYGSQVLTAFHAKLAELSALLAEAAGPVENPDVKVAADGILNIMAELEKTVEDLHSKVYGEQLGGPDQQQPAPGDEQLPDEEAMKSFLASGRVPVVTFKGCAYGLKTLLRDRTLSDAHRKTIVDHLERLAEFEVSAKSHVKSAIDKEAAAVRRNVIEAVREFNDFLPHLRGVAG